MSFWIPGLLRPFLQSPPFRLVISHPVHRPSAITSDRICGSVTYCQIDQVLGPLDYYRARFAPINAPF